MYYLVLNIVHCTNVQGTLLPACPKEEYKNTSKWIRYTVLGRRMSLKSILKKSKFDNVLYIASRQIHHVCGVIQGRPDQNINSNYLRNSSISSRVFKQSAKYLYFNFLLLNYPNNAREKSVILYTSFAYFFE